jgi:hypothetical protein
MTTILGINVRVSETLGITAELEITSQVADFIKQILSLVLGMWWKLYCEDRIKPLFI